MFGGFNAKPGFLGFDLFLEEKNDPFVQQSDGGNLASNEEINDSKDDKSTPILTVADVHSTLGPSFDKIHNDNLPMLLMTALR